MKRRKTGFEAFTQKIFILVTVLFVFGIIGIKSVESSYNKQIQQLNNQIETLNSEIDSLEMQKQELVSFQRLSDIATSQGYTYQNDATATTLQ